jgi:hypothetical protein
MTVPRVALAGGKPGRGRLQGRDRVDLPGPGADGVPVGEYRVVPVAEQLSAVDVAVGRLVRELEARLPVARPGMLAASSVRCGGSARARASQGPGSPGRSAAGGRARPGCDGGPELALLCRSPRRTSDRPAVDGRQPAALASCSGRWSLSAAKVPCARPLQGARLPSWAGPGSACWLPGWLPAGPTGSFPCPIGTAQHADLRERRSLPSRRCTISCSPASDQRSNTEASKRPLSCENVELRRLELRTSCMP